MGGNVYKAKRGRDQEYSRRDFPPQSGSDHYQWSTGRKAWEEKPQKVMQF